MFKKFLVILSIALFSVIGVVDATMQGPEIKEEPNNEVPRWHLGENLKKGDYFEFSVCHIDYENCKAVLLKIWIKDEIQVASETKWLAETVVYDEDKIIKGEMELGKIAAIPLGSSYKLMPYAQLFKESIAWLSAFGVIEVPLDFPNSISRKLCALGCAQPKVIGVESITIPGGTFDAQVISWKTNHNTTSNIWIVDDFPFPVKAIVYPFHTP